MHSLFRTRGAILAGLLVLALASLTPALASAKPEPGAKKPRGFRLLAGSQTSMAINSVDCGVTSNGQVCVALLGSSTGGGGFWPKGTPDQYIFNSGLQLAGVVSGGPWDGDTTGAWFFSARGGESSDQVQPIYNSVDADDAANWPLQAMVPSGDASADLFNPLLQTDSTSVACLTTGVCRRVKASQGDIWWMAWDGNPAQVTGRPHPLGVLVETRGMGWNYPSGNQDIIYFIYTFYNITSTVAADYAAVRPEIRSILLDQAAIFQATNNAAFNISLPAGGYTINKMFAAFATDMDVSLANTNYSSVNLPFALGYTYEHTFSGEPGWDFNPGIFGAPFFAGAGFAGIKYLKAPSGPGAINLFSNTVNTSATFRPIFVDPANATQLWRYLSGNISVPAGDLACNTGDPTVSKICWLNNTAPADVRFFQSSTELSLPPGGVGSIVVAYIFAAPVAIPGCSAAPCTTTKPGDPTILGNIAKMATGVNRVDSLTGYVSSSDVDGNGIITQATATGVPEFKVVNGSLLGKSYTAQSVFNAKFLLPFAPEPPNFFLIPGSNQVTIMWQLSASETSGDPYYSVAQNVSDAALYDPNYRRFDVEGYRIYRGRVDSPDQLALIAQFDYAGTVFDDYAGVVNFVPTCAPELNIYIACPVPYTAPAPGVPRTVKHANPLVGNIIQVKAETASPDRLKLATGLAFVATSDTALTGGNSGLPNLADTGVPFTYVDINVSNNFRYFYVVTAFDVNSLTSAPSSLSSPKGNTKSVTPQLPASNYENAGNITSQGIYGRGVALDYKAAAPALDPVTGKFAGLMPASNGWTIGLESFVAQVLSAPGNFAVRLDSIGLGSSYSGPITQVKYYLSALSGSSVTPLVLPLAQDPTFITVSGAATFPAVFIDGTLAAIYGGDANYFLKGAAGSTLVGTYYSNAYGRGCVNNADGFGTVNANCSYQGPRWFAGPSPANNETETNPNFGNTSNNSGNLVNTTLPNSTGWNNAGKLPGVLVINNPQSYETVQNLWRQVEGVGSGAKRMADYNVYWGAAGRVDSVIDVTHNVPVPFNASIYRGGWGFLNAAAANNLLSYDTRAPLTIGDIGCVEPYKSTGVVGGAAGVIPCTSPTAYALSQTAIPGVTAFVTASTADAAWGAKVAPVATFPGFILLLGGEIYQFELADAAGTLPAPGTVWSVRDYVGAITGGNGYAGNKGPYAFTASVRPFTAVGTELRVNFDVTNQVNATSNLDLTKVHTVPDPYYVTDAYEVSYDNKIIKFVNLPTQATIRIYSSSGVLVRVLNFNSTGPDAGPYQGSELGGALSWDVKNRNNQIVASGVYFYHVESGDARFIGRMTIINFTK